ncbi:retrotransposon protein [Cucumis melo var. makuwa]|uniref:Retrotransposon protein n=1 Tax=Cucumis melo var. makuwa TaxID=1194695 RepID=A0A5D3BDC7_CUCMM|nr:retrotransposon protein [Cucumis melo var. makuwa]
MVVSRKEIFFQYQTLVGKLAAAFVSLAEEEILIHTLNGFPAAFNAFRTSIRSRSGIIFLEELHTLLISKESTIAKSSAIEAFPTAIATAQNFHTSHGSCGRGRKNGLSFFFFFLPQLSSSAYHTTAPSLTQYNFKPNLQRDFSISACGVASLTPSAGPQRHKNRATPCNNPAESEPLKMSKSDTTETKHDTMVGRERHRAGQQEIG